MAVAMSSFGLVPSPGTLPNCDLEWCERRCGASCYRANHWRWRCAARRRLKANHAVTGGAIISVSDGRAVRCGENHEVRERCSSADCGDGVVIVVLQAESPADAGQAPQREINHAGIGGVRMGRYASCSSGAQLDQTAGKTGCGPK